MLTVVFGEEPPVFAKTSTSGKHKNIHILYFGYSFGRITGFYLL